MQESVIHSKVLGNCANDFDVLVRIVSTTDSITATHQWLYNRRSELVGASGTQTHPYDYAYSYDSIGNRLTSSDDSGIATYVANSLNQYTAVNRTIEQLVLRSFSEGGSNNFTYDADGNLTQDDRFNYAYDDENRLVSVMPTNPIYGSRAIENAYDHRNRRIRKVVKSYDGSSWNVTETSLFIWDGWNLKSKSQCVRNGVPIFLVFDGQALSGSGFYVVAASGRPISSIKTVWTSKEKFPWGSIYGGIITEYSFDYSVDKQKIKSVGPTPEGNYWIEVNEQRNYRTSKYSHIVLRKGWGDYSWSLHPEASTQTYGRSGFFIHGGENWGSAGCIDIKSGDRQLKTFLDGLCDCYVPVKVKYSVKSNKLSEKETTWINVPSPQGYPFVR